MFRTGTHWFFATDAMQMLTFVSGNHSKIWNANTWLEHIFDSIRINGNYLYLLKTNHLLLAIKILIQLKIHKIFTNMY